MWLLVCVATIPFVLNLLPLSCLAAVLILVGYKLTKPDLIKKMYKKGANQFLPFAATITAIMFTDLLVGIALGMMVGFIFVIRSSIHKSIVMVHDEKDYLIRFHKDVSFLQKRVLLQMFDEIPENSNVVIDGSRNVFIDHDIEELVEDFVLRSPLNKVVVTLRKSTTALSPLFREEQNG